jgi:hypothetical protein
MTRKIMFLSLYTLIMSLAVLKGNALMETSTHAAVAPATESATPVQGVSASNPCGLNVKITGTANKGQQGNNDVVQVNWEFKNLAQCLKVDKSEVEVTITRGGTPSVGKLTINGSGTVATVQVPRVAPGSAKTPSTIKATVKAFGSLTTNGTDASQALLGSGN